MSVHRVSRRAVSSVCYLRGSNALCFVPSAAHAVASRSTPLCASTLSSGGGGSASEDEEEEPGGFTKLARFYAGRAEGGAGLIVRRRTQTVS